MLGQPALCPSSFSEVLLTVRAMISATPESITV